MTIIPSYAYRPQKKSPSRRDRRRARGKENRKETVLRYRASWG